MGRTEARDLVSRCAALAALLEVSAYPKPGNVHRTRDFPDTRYEHFLAGSVAMGTVMGKMATRGFDAERGSIEWQNIGVGRHVLEAILDTLKWQSGGNVNLGVVLLFAPLAAAGGAAVEDSKVDVENHREKLRKVIHSTIPDDAISVYEAIRIAMTPKVLGEVEDLDVHDDSSPQRIMDQGFTLLDVFERCSERDSICEEWVSNFETTFEIGYPYLKRSLEEARDINSAVLDTFLFILSGKPDSLIRRKSGLEKAREVSRKARIILEEGGSGSARGSGMLHKLDDELYRGKGTLNPGTTADLTAASIFVALLEGWRP